MWLFLSYEKFNYLLQNLRNITCIDIQITRMGGGVGGGAKSSLPNIYAYEYFCLWLVTTRVIDQVI